MTKNINISVDLPDDVDKLWKEATKLAKEKGVAIEGNEAKGSFSIAGCKATYKTSGKTLNVHAEKVPFFVSEKMVRKEIEKWFNSRA
jgi:hypothetical protein